MAEWKEAPPGPMEPDEKVALVLDLVQSPEFLIGAVVLAVVLAVSIAMQVRAPRHSRRRMLDDVYPHTH